MKKSNKIGSTLLLVAAFGFTASSNAFIDPEEWKMEKWGKWNEWDGPPDMKRWRTDQWGDMDQWGGMPSGDRRLPWEMRSGSMPWKGNHSGMPWGGNGGSMPWGGNGGSMPWGGNGGGMPWGGNGGGMPWGGNGGGMPWGGPQQGWSGPRGYAPNYGPYAPAPYGKQMQRGRNNTSQQPYHAEPNRYPKRPNQEVGKSVPETVTAPAVN
jgi:hypothetical protein